MDKYGIGGADGGMVDLGALEAAAQLKASQSQALATKRGPCVSYSVGGFESDALLLSK